MADLLAWEPGLATGHAVLDEQHAALLALCQEMGADAQPGQGPEAECRFDERLERLRALALRHLDTEAELLAGQGDAVREAHEEERESLAYLLSEVATTAHFDRAELQRFIALWVYGHVRGAAARRTMRA